MNYDNNSEEGEHDAPFNMSLFYYQNLIKLVEWKDEKYLNNDLKNWYKGLYTIYKRIIFKLKPVEEKEIQDLLDVAQAMIKKGEKPVNELHIIDKKLYKLMDSYKMIFPRIDNNRGLNKITNRYDLKKTPVGEKL
jgi:hypothetical protein